MSTGPNMATITAALERSLQNCSLSHRHYGDSHSHLQSHSHGATNSRSHGATNSNSSSNSNEVEEINVQSQTTLDLNSHTSLPYHWEQCLDLKTGEIYYINWRNGMKAKEDPRSTTEDQYSEDYDEYSDDDDDDDSSYDSEESSTELLSVNNKEEEREKEDHVLVVAGCKSCLMYFMVPKHLEDCPKCNGQLLHFDRSENDIIP